MDFRISRLDQQQTEIKLLQLSDEQKEDILIDSIMRSEYVYRDKSDEWKDILLQRFGQSFVRRRQAALLKQINEINDLIDGKDDTDLNSKYKMRRYWDLSNLRDRYHKIWYFHQNGPFPGDIK